MEKFKRAIKAVRGWLVGVFDLKDVKDLLLQGLNLMTSGTLVNWLAGFWASSPPALNVVYIVGTFMMIFGLLSLGKRKVRSTVPMLREPIRPQLGSPDTRALTFYENQPAMFAAKLDYDSVLADPDVKKVWIAAITAGRLGRMKDVEIAKVEKLVVAKTATTFFTHLFEERGNPDGSGYGVELSNASAKRAKENGTAVVYHEHPIIQCLVVFRHDNDDWLRWEPILPSVKPGDWPSVVVTSSRDSATFTKLADAFLRHFEAGIGYDDY